MRANESTTFFLHDLVDVPNHRPTSCETPADVPGPHLQLHQGSHVFCVVIHSSPGPQRIPVYGMFGITHDEQGWIRQGPNPFRYFSYRPVDQASVPSSRHLRLFRPMCLLNEAMSSPRRGSVQHMLHSTFGIGQLLETSAAWLIETPSLEP